MSARRVLLTTDVVGGVWDFCLTLATALLERDAVCVTLLALGDPSRDQRDMAAALGVEIRSAPLKLEWMEDSAADVAATALLVADVAREVRADVIHANQFAAVCAPSDVPVVLTLHSDVLSWRKWTLADASVPPEWDAYATLVRDALRRADSVVAVSRFLADEVASLYGVRRTINVIHNGWPAPTLSEHVRRGTLLAGRVWDAAKNITLAADAAYGWAPGEVAVAGEQVHPQGGIAPLPAPLQPLGLLPRAQLDAWLMKTAVYLSPARYDPFGLLPLQAALHGCALLLSDIPSYRELWTGAARFFTANDSDDLRDQWQRLLTDDALRTDLAHRAAKRAATYTPRRLADSYHAQYREATARIAA